jgi:spermidine synthase
VSRALVLGCFLVSGASSLVYEIVWMRQLELTVGATTAAVSALLAVFIVGLGAGARAFGPLADRSRAPLRLYALLEAGIALYALALPWLLAETSPLYLALARAAAGRAGLLLALRLGFGCLLLLAPTMLMGGTLPVLARLVDRAPARFGRDLGLLYGANLTGALLGAAACGFALVPALGLRGATLAAATANLAIAAAALVLGGMLPSAAGQAAAAQVGGPRLPAGAGGPVLAVVALSGFTTMGYEVLFTRILSFTFTSTIHAFTIILASFLAGLALGSALFALLERRLPGLPLLGVTQCLAGIAALALAPLAVAAPEVVAALSRRWGYTGGVFLAAMALSSALVILLPATLMGLAFPLGSRLLVDDAGAAGRRIGRAYFWNSLGCVFGSLLTGFALIPLLGLVGGVLFLSGAQLAAGAALLLRWGSPGQRWSLALAAAAALAARAAPASLRGSQPFDVQARQAGAVVLAESEGVAATTSVVRYPDGRKALRIDGFEAAGEGGRYGYMALMTHLPALLHPQPRRLLVICFGTGTTAGAALLHPELRVDAVDLNPAVFEFAPRFRAANLDVAGDPRARLILDDGRNYLATTRERYDVITSEPMPPTFLGAGNLYAREYYALARERLRPGGFVVQWLPFHLLRLDQALSILRAVLDVFPDATLWVHEDTGLIVARRDSALVLDLETLRARLSRPALRAAVEALGIPGAEPLLERYALGPAALRRLTARAAPVTDDRPSLEFHTPRHRAVLRLGAGYQLEEARTLELVYRFRAAEPLPLAGASPQDALRLAAARAFDSRLLLGDLYLGMWLQGPARQELEEGLRRAADPSQRSRALAALAELARRERAGAARLPAARE